MPWPRWPKRFTRRWPADRADLADLGGVHEVLNLAYQGEADASRACAARLLAAPALGAAGRVAVVAASAMADYVSARYADALVVATRAKALAAGVDDERATFLAQTAYALGLANVPAEARGTDRDEFAVAFAMRDVLRTMDPPLRIAASAFLVEAAFAHGRIGDAGILLEDRADVAAHADQTAHMITLQAVRVDIFSGQIARSLGQCEALIEVSKGARLDVVLSLAHGFLALIVAYQGDTAAALAHAHAAESTVRQPATMLEGGAHTVAGYAMAALGRHSDARRLILSGGGGPDLHVSQLVDRAIGFDILVAAALADGDLDGAVAWAKRAAPLAHTIAAAHVIEQMAARIALAQGDAEASAGSAERASTGARAIGRYLEATAADLAHARATIAGGRGEGVVGKLNAVAHDAEAGGALALRALAAAELRRLGRRVLPARGAGLAVLSPREQQVAALAAEGFSNKSIGQALFLSERTVQAHLHRAMQAMGVSQRSALPAALRTGAPVGEAPAGGLTPRQEQVSLLVHAGLSNAEISAQLGLSVKTVEKHVAAIFERWGVSSRTGISRVVAGQAPSAGAR